MNKNIIILLVAIAIFAVSFWGGGKIRQSFGFSVDSQPGVWYDSTTNTTSTVYTYATSVAVVMNKNINRRWARCCNNGGYGVGPTATVWLHEASGTTSLSVNKGIRLDYATSSPYNCFVWDDSHPYSGTVYAIASATGTVVCSEK